MSHCVILCFLCFIVCFIVHAAFVRIKLMMISLPLELCAHLASFVRHSEIFTDRISASSVRPSVRLSVCPSVRPFVSTLSSKLTGR